MEELLWATQDFGECAVEELSWATRDDFGQYAVEATLGYSVGLLRDHAVEELLLPSFGERAVEKLLWATQGSLWPVCCERATLGYSGITLASVL